MFMNVFQVRFHSPFQRPDFPTPVDQSEHHHLNYYNYDHRNHHYLKFCKLLLKKYIYIMEPVLRFRCVR